MRSFRTELLPAPSPLAIRPGDSMVTIGSCFSDSIGLILKHNKFDVLVNPAGTVYSPLAIHKIINYAISNSDPADAGWMNHNGLWHHLDFHSSFSGPAKTDVQNSIATALAALCHALHKPGLLLITYGTSWIYEYLPTGEPVANCHKIPSSKFQKKLLTPEEITDSFDKLYQALRIFNPGKEIVVTLSPVRHVRDSLEMNTLGKAAVRLALHRLAEKYPHVHYFPAYEIMMDDLRDYRFYERDMIHPSGEAIEYIWNLFSERYFDEDLRTVLAQWQQLAASLNHRPFHPEGAAHQKFVRKTLAQLEELKSSLAVDEEINQLRAQLT